MRKLLVMSVLVYGVSIAAALTSNASGLVILGALSDDDGAPVRDTASPFRAPAIKAETIDFQSQLPPGSILVRTGERRLYFILPGGKAIRYGVGVGREGFAWSGSNKITRKAEWPDWRPPAVMIAREAKRNHFIPDFMKGGVDNPLGARALYIGDTEFRIHGTTQPWSIGRAVSSGCIRMLNDEVVDLYNRVSIGATVVVE